MYDDAGTKLVSLTYDAWGNSNITYHIAMDGSLEAAMAKNPPMRYRGYYYDFELELYWLGTRCYDSITGRFLSPDTTAVLTATPMALTDKNLYAYCDNNPVMRVDHGGEFWDTVFDVISLIWSIGDVCANPTNGWAWAGLVGDAIDLIPFVSGVGETTRALRVADDVHDTAKAIDNTIDTYKSLKKAKKGTGLEVHHIVEKRFAKDLDIEDTGEMLSVALTKSEHRIYTNAWRDQIGYGTGRHSQSEIWNAAKNIYANRPDLLEAARKTIFRR